MNNIPEDSSPSLTWRGQWLGWSCLTMLAIFTWLPNSYFLMVSWPWIAVWQVGFLLLGVWAIWMLRQFKLPFKPLGYGFDWVVGLGAIALILSGIFCQFKEVAAWNISLVFCYVVLLYVLRNWLGRGGLTIDRLWMGVCIVGVIGCAIGLFNWYPEFAAGFPRNQYPMGHPNFVAGYILLVLPLTIARAISTKSWQRIGSLAASLLMLLTLYTTSSRGGFLGAAIAMIIAVGFAIVKSKGKKRWISLVVCLLAISLFAFVAVQNPRVRQIVKIGSQTSNSQAIELKVDPESRDRLLMLQATLNILKDRPLFGVGPGNMSRVYGLYRPIETGTGANITQELHNTVAQIVGELGLFGLSIYLLLIGLLAYWWFKLYAKISTHRERYLLYSIGISLLAYIFSSLTDYQLENISISSILSIHIVLFVELVEFHDVSKANYLNNYIRRWFSLGSITALFLALLLWMPVALAMQLCSSANSDIQAKKLAQGYEKLVIAASLAPWDHVYSALAGYQALKIRGPVEDKKLYRELTEMSLKHFKKAVKAAPNDPPFNQMLGTIYSELNDSKSAALYFHRTIQLLPRNFEYTYYLLGNEYLKQGRREEAIAAFALQGLISPNFLLARIWDSPALAKVKQTVLQETLNLYTELIAQLSPNDPNYNLVYENMTILRWWGQYPLENVETNRLHAIVQALILADRDPKLAVNFIDRTISSQTYSNALLLLRDWLNADSSLKKYLASNSVIDRNEKRKKELQQSIRQHRNLREWMISIGRPIEILYRNGLYITYRNLQIANIEYMLLPKEIEYVNVVEFLDLFGGGFPREFIPLEYLIDRTNKEKLKLEQPVMNNFEL
ncbi:MAG: O-antigen ligase family protein [Xenococcaceae cyanobacterium]